MKLDEMSHDREPESQPPKLRVVELVSLTKRSNTRGRNSGSIPCPCPSPSHAHPIILLDANVIFRRAA
jgi:hypothetical protein